MNRRAQPLLIAPIAPTRDMLATGQLNSNPSLCYRLPIITPVPSVRQLFRNGTTKLQCLIASVRKLSGSSTARAGVSTGLRQHIRIANSANNPWIMASLSNRLGTWTAISSGNYLSSLGPIGSIAFGLMIALVIALKIMPLAPSAQTMVPVTAPLCAGSQSSEHCTGTI